MNTNAIRAVNRNMDMQLRYVEEILELVEDCENRLLLDDVDETEIQQIRDHCRAIAMAAATAKKLAKNLEPVYKEEDEKKKAEEKAKKKAGTAEKRNTKKKAETKPQTVETADSGPEEDDDDLSMLE